MIRVSGDRVAVRWTTNALEKLGIGVASGNSSEASVVWDLVVRADDSGHAHVWDLLDPQGRKQSANSIQHLKAIINQSDLGTASFSKNRVYKSGAVD